jgi:hypothetical protein
VAAIVQQEVRWHLAQLLPRLALTEQQRTRAVVILSGFLDDDSRTVRTFAMPALADLAQGDERLRRRVLPLLTELTRTGTPAMRSRGRKLLARLQRGRPLVGDRLAEHGLEPLGRGPYEIGQVDLVMLAAPAKPLVGDEAV